MRRILCLLVILLPAWWAHAQDEEILRAARFLSGASSDEQVDEYWVSRLEARWGRRIRINAAHVRADGLLTDYQLATLADYRSTSGDIRSWEELALVDGFSRELVDVLRPFLSLESERMGVKADSVRFRGTVLARGTLGSIGAKARLSGSWWQVGGAWRGSGWTFYADAAWRRHRLVAGDFHLRFGQGLALWSGFSISSLSTVDAFVRRTSGLSPAWSYSSESVLRGAAYSYSGAHFRAYAFGTLDGLFGTHADWQGRSGQVGASVAYQPGGGGLIASVDTRWNLFGADLAVEVALRNGSLAGLAAFRRPIGPFKLAVQGRAVPSRFSLKKNGEYALAAGLSYRSEHWVSLSGKSGFGSSTPAHQASCTVDAALLPVPGGDPRRFQVRVYALWQWQLAPQWCLDLRLTERYRNYEPPRTGLRADLRFASGPWMSVARFENVFCEHWGILGYLEGGYKGTLAGRASTGTTPATSHTLSANMRLTAFRIDSWNDRIYVYERDAAGTFSVPAYSGRGLSASLVGSWKQRFRLCTLKAHLRAAWMVRIGRPPTPTLNLQLQCEW